MNRNEFCKHHWEYYLVLENDFLITERFVSFDLGENYIYDGNDHEVAGNSMTFSNEYIKQYQAICSEVDVILKSICKELGNPTATNMKDGYTPTVLTHWSAIVSQKSKIQRCSITAICKLETNAIPFTGLVDTIQSCKTRKNRKLQRCQFKKRCKCPCWFVHFGELPR